MGFRFGGMPGFGFPLWFYRRGRGDGVVVRGKGVGKRRKEVLVYTFAEENQ